MIRVKGNKPQAMEFASFKIKKDVTEDDLINAIIAFEESFLQNQKGILLHCLVKNQMDTYANVLFAESETALKEMQETANKNEFAGTFFSMIESETVSMNIHTIENDSFQIPTSFACVEHGTFKLNANVTLNDLKVKSHKLEEEYLNHFTNSKAHYIGSLNNSLFSEVTFGESLGKTKQICFGYLQNKIGLEFLELLDDKTMQLDFYSVLA